MRLEIARQSEKEEAATDVWERSEVMNNSWDIEIFPERGKDCKKFTCFLKIWNEKRKYFWRQKKKRWLKETTAMSDNKWDAIPTLRGTERAARTLWGWKKHRRGERRKGCEGRKWFMMDGKGNKEENRQTRIHKHFERDENCLHVLRRRVHTHREKEWEE